MVETEKQESDDFSTNGEIKNLRTSLEKKRFCIEQARELFADDEIMTLRVAIGEGWPEKLPELAKKFPTLKKTPLDLIYIIGPNVFIDDYATIENRAWLTGSTKDVVKAGIETKEEGENDDDEDDEADIPAAYVEIKLFFGQDCSIEEVDHENKTVLISLFEEDDRNFEIWSLVEEKTNLYVERKSAKRKGESQRLVITSEILALAKETLNT